MRKKKEIVIVIIIVLFTIFLAFMPMMINNKSEEELSVNKTNMINIKVTGEIKKEEINIKIPYGYSYGYIINKIEVYLNKYSIVDENKTKRYYEDSVIVIRSSDINNNITDINNNTGLIDINNAGIDELIKLYGVGEKRAKAIIDYREKKKIETFVELKELLGVSDEVINNIKEKAFL